MNFSNAFLSMKLRFKVWWSFLPVILRSRVDNNPDLRKILSNTGWLFADNIIRLGVGLIVSVWIARYLGPEQFGLFSYAMAFVAIFGAIASLGLNGIVVRDLVRQPETANATLGTAFVLQLIGGLLAFCLAVISIGYVRPNDALAKLMVAVLGFVMVFKSGDVVKYWFESRVNSKYAAWVENFAFLIFAGVKIVLVLCKVSLIAFAWVVLTEAALVFVALLSMYAWRGGHLSCWQVKIKQAKTLLNDSWPLILSGLAIMIYMRIDQLMLGEMLGDEAVGIYSVAVRISEVWYFIPMVIVASVFPAIIAAKKESEALYYQRLQKLYDFMVVLALLVAVPMTLLSDWIVTLLFGHAYQLAGQVLAIHAWTGMFVFLGVASGKWFLIENMQKNAFYRTTAGLLANICANFFLIPLYGAIGAAIGTLVSQIVAAYLFDAVQKKTRRSFILKTSSLLQFFVIIKKKGET
jgi:PST family polysaccharide transporter